VKATIVLCKIKVCWGCYCYQKSGVGAG